jgi:UDP-N-acetylmuramate dehydrogenase
MEILRNHSLKTYNTFGIDVKADFFVKLSSIKALQELINNQLYQENNSLILGGGSNILFTKDFNGLVLKTDFKGIKLEKEDEDFYYISAMAGEQWHSFVLKTIENNWQGLENLSLIPGSVGAAPIQNIGAYGVEVGDHIKTVKTIDLKDGKLCSFTAAECKFGYRNSVFKQQLKGKYLIYEVVFKLNKKPHYNIGYAALSEYLKHNNAGTVNAKTISEAVISVRKSKLPDPAEIGNCGSFFKNPVISSTQFNVLHKDYPAMPHYAVESGQVKIPAGWLIQTCGFKGEKVGRVGTYEKQALVIINLGNATGSEAFSFAQNIISKVENRFGIRLEPEVNIM